MKLSHVGLTVANLERSIKFYSGAFGMVPVHRVVREDKWLADVIGWHSCRLFFAHLKHKESGFHLELIQYETPKPLRSPMPPTDPWRGGVQHFALEVEDIERQVGLATSHGGYMLSHAIGTIEDGPNRGTRCVYLRGPDGEIIELAEKPK